MSADGGREAPPATSVARGDVARGAVQSGLARAGAIIEALAQPLYIWLFGIATYGIYVVLWATINLVTNIINLSMPNALQRVVPAMDGEDLAHGAVRLALLVSVGPATLLALVISLNADALAPLFSVAQRDAAHLPRAIALFAWALPLWGFVEVATAAARARRAFGPEIRIRIFWEQLARILFAISLFVAGLHSMGLFIAHLCSLLVTAFLCVRLLGRYYDPRRLLTAPMPRGLVRNLLLSGIGLLPPNLSRRTLIDAPPMMLNMLLPGAAGAAAAGLFEVGRKLSTIPYIVRQSFQYVLAPLATAQARLDRAALPPLYHFASRVSTALALPLAGLVIFAGPALLRIYGPEAAAAFPILAILTMARAVEAVAGPATVIVEMIGHRLLPLLNSTLAILLWAGLALFLVPRMGAPGMALAVAIGTLAPAYAALAQLRALDGLSPFDRYLGVAALIGIAGIAAMALARHLLGDLRVLPLLFLLWAMTSWLALRYGLAQEDRQALGPFSRKLCLIR